MRKVGFCPPWSRSCLAVAVIAGVSLACGGSTSTGDSSSSGLVGAWKDVEESHMGIEFTSQGGFSEYFYGEVVGFGKYEVQGNRLTLHYLSTCGGENQLSCDVRLAFNVTRDMLVITDSIGDMPYTRVDSLR